MADADAENVGDVTLVATGDNSSITFNTAAAQFDSLSATADDGAAAADVAQRLLDTCKRRVVGLFHGGQRCVEAVV